MAALHGGKVAGGSMETAQLLHIMSQRQLILGTMPLMAHVLDKLPQVYRQLYADYQYILSDYTFLGLTSLTHTQQELISEATAEASYELLWKDRLAVEPGRRVPDGVVVAPPAFYMVSRINALVTHVGELYVDHRVSYFCDVAWYASLVLYGPTQESREQYTDWVAHRLTNTKLEIRQFLERVLQRMQRPKNINDFTPSPMALAMAKEIYEQETWKELSVLADLLEDRDEGPQSLRDSLRDPFAMRFRGCWDLDMILGYN